MIPDYFKKYSTYYLSRYNVTKKKFENISVNLLSVDKAKFRKPVCPGDVLRMEVKKKNNVKNIWKFVCKSFVDNNLVAEAEIAAILSDINY